MHLMRLWSDALFSFKISQTSFPHRWRMGGYLRETNLRINTNFEFFLLKRTFYSQILQKWLVISRWYAKHLLQPVWFITKNHIDIKVNFFSCGPLIIWNHFEYFGIACQSKVTSNGNVSCPNNLLNPLNVYLHFINFTLNLLNSLYQ